MSEEELFLHAIELPAEQRDEFLRVACGDNLALFERVRQLLSAHDQPASFLNRPVVAPAAAEATLTVDASASPNATGANVAVAPHEVRTIDHVARPPSSPSADFVGTVIAGRYTLIEVIGEGGMGSVYRASQTEPVKRQVALKLIKTGMDSKAVLARFDAERQALALMDHPNIARIFDGGVTPSGQPFFVMELVHGVPLTEYCDTKRLSVDARLQLFVLVCQAVQHAHQKGIIHRDLKPGNVLVTEVDGRPTPKVIDFGVAKATEQKLTDQSFSDTGAIVGTPAYMSPEQADPTSMDIDTRTDVYALGVMLYELLTGSPPIDSKQFQRGAILEMLRMVREVEPPRPSTKLSSSEALPNIAANRSIEPAKLSKLLQGELDWVVMKALEKDRTRRYETANGLARDLERYLADEVVEARPPSRRYRLKKFVRRNKGQVLAASLVLLALVAGVVGTSIGMTQARQANRELAEKNAALETEQIKVEQRFEMARKSIATFHKVITDEKVLENDAFKNLRKKLLTVAAGFYRELETLLAGEADAKSRMALADGLFQLAYLTDQIGDKTNALASYEKARDIQQKLADANPTVTSYQNDLAKSRFNIGNLQRVTGKPADALTSYQKARDIQQKLADANPAVTSYQSDLARSHIGIGVALSDTGKPAEALASYEKARDIQQKLADANPTVTSYQSQLAFSHYSIGNRLSQTGKPAEALASYEKARDIQQKLADVNPAVTEFQSDLARSHNNIGSVLSDTGKPAEALASYQKARDIHQKLADANPAVTQFQSDLARSYIGIGNVLATTGKPAEALSSYEKARDILQKLADANPAVTRFQSDLAISYNNIGLVLSDTGKPADALASYQKARDIRQKLADGNPAVTSYQSDLANSDSNIGSALSAKGQSADALASYEKARDILQKLANADPTLTYIQSELAFSYNNMAFQLSQTGKPEESLAFSEQARDILQKLVKANPTVPQYQSSLAYSYQSIGNRYFDIGKPAEALVNNQKALELRQKLADAHPKVTLYQSELAASQNTIGRRLFSAGNLGEALVSYEKALVIRQKLADANPTVTQYQLDLANSHYNIGLVLSQTGKPVEALASYEKGRDIFRKLSDTNPTILDYLRYLANSHNNIGLLLSQTGKPAEALAIHEKARDVRQKLADANPAVTEFQCDLANSHYNIACCYAVASRKHADKPEEAKVEADKAMESLRKAVSTGYKNVAHMKKDTDLDPLREREDFQKLVAELEAKSAPEPLPIPKELK